MSGPEAMAGSNFNAFKLSVIIIDIIGERINVNINVIPITNANSNG
jgi:hypothetical protein